MKRTTRITGIIGLLALLWLLSGASLLTARPPGGNGPMAAVEERVRQLMAEGDIPGLSLVIVRGDGQPVYMKGFGYADLHRKTPVTADTLFELASCSKAFTALAALKCEADGLLDLEAPVSRYLPWFYALYEGKEVPITGRQLLHHTSGIPARTIGLVPPDESGGALQNTVRQIAGIELDTRPGQEFQYATVNYDIVAAAIEKVSGLGFEEYLGRQVLLPLGLNATRPGTVSLSSRDRPQLASGYKIGFFKARPFSAPVFRGNTPAGYVITNARDMARWLKLQLGLVKHPYGPLIFETQQRDESVPPQSASLQSYGLGWQVSLDGSGTVSHAGLNPNFSAVVMLRPGDQTGLAVMANSNSRYTRFIGQTVMDVLDGKTPPAPANLSDAMDKGSSLFAVLLALYLLGVVGFMGLILLDIIRGRRRFQALTPSRIFKLMAPLLLLAPVLLAVYLLPRALADFSWKAALVWAPVSFGSAVVLLLAALAASWVGYIFSCLFPHRNKYVRTLPMLIIISIVSGLANAVVIFLITISLFSRAKIGYLLYYFVLAMLVYIIGRKVLQTRLTHITHHLIYDLRMKLVGKLFNTSYQKFEKLEGGRILATLNNDTNQIGGSANFLVALISSFVTVIGAFVYLATIAFWATAVTLLVIFLIAAVYYVVTQRANAYLNEARTTQNAWMGLLNGLQQGFKELSLHCDKKTAFSAEVGEVCGRFRDKQITALVKFVNAFMIGESMLIVVLGAVGFVIPVLFPQLHRFTLMSFIMVLLYLIGPVNNILNAIPGIAQIQISWNRVKGFMEDIPANIEAADRQGLPRDNGSIRHIEAKGIRFEYEAATQEETFTVGPLDFEINRGEIVFVIGGNGSGKTTLAKLLTGLYIPGDGTITVDGQAIDNHQLGEYFSVVFGDYHLFEKLYDVDLTGKEAEVRRYLKMLRLEQKVSLDRNAFSTLDLSGGQRKRLALLRCYLEDRPVYLFDEVAADQDPEFRRFFYRDLLLRMKEKGKMVIAITHDDHYFDVADRLIKMDMGRVELLSAGERLNVTG
jgi:putative ATP-binding cassette transporter